MKKFVAAVLLALPLLGLTQQKAAAWYKFNWSAGFNMSWESGGDKCYLCGLFKVHDPRCGDGYGYADMGDGHGGGEMQYYPAYDRGSYHTQGGGMEYAPSHEQAFPPAPKPADDGKQKTSTPSSGAWYYGNQTSYYNYGYQPTGSYNYGGAGYGYYQGPYSSYYQPVSYWYGR
jgi:hypothetical protein